MHFTESHPSASFFHDLADHSQVQDVALHANAIAMHHVEFGNPKWWRNLVFNYFHANTLADYVFAILQRTDSTHINPA